MNDCISVLYIMGFTGFVIQCITTTVGLTLLRKSKKHVIVFWLIAGGLIPLLGYFASFFAMPIHCLPLHRSTICFLWFTGAMCGYAIGGIVNELQAEKQKQSQNAQKKQE